MFVTALNKIRVGLFDKNVASTLSQCICDESIDMHMRKAPEDIEIKNEKPIFKLESNTSISDDIVDLCDSRNSSGEQSESSTKETDPKHKSKDSESIEATILHSHNAVVQRVNAWKLRQIDKPPQTFQVRTHFGLQYFHI